MGIQLKEIRRAIALGLRTGGEDPPAPVIPEVGERVFANRTRPFDDRDLPAIDVRTEDDKSEDMRSDSPPEYVRVARVTIDLAVAGNPGEDFEFDLVDEIGQVIEDYMGRLDLPRMWECQYISFEGTDVYEGRVPIWIARWTYEVTYHEKSPRDEDLTDLVPFQTLFVEYDLPGTTEDPEATDQITIPQD